MIKWLYKCLLLITGMFFALAIMEIHGENSLNTFFDQDDVYIQSNNQNIELSSHIEKQNDSSYEFKYLITITFTLFSSDIKTAYVSRPPKNFGSQKIFLQNSAWRI